MIFFLTTQPIWVSGAIIVGLGTLLSVLGTVLVRRYADVKRLTPDTEIAGFKFGTIGVLYAVLLAFAIIVVWEKYSDAELDVVQEAGAAENIYRLSQGLSDNARVAVLHSVADYLETAINVDWPTMDQGTAGTRGATKQALDAVYAALVSSSGHGDSTVVSEMPVARFMAISQVPVSGDALRAKATVAAWKQKPSYAVIPMQDRMINPDLERFMTKRAQSQVIELPGSHAIFLSHAPEVAALIEKAATEAK
jgi:hypothetical protein